MPTLKAPRKTATPVKSVKKATTPTKPSVAADKIAKAKAAAAAKKTAKSAPATPVKKTAATKTAAAVKKAAVGKKPRTTRSTTPKADTTASTTRKLNLFTAAEVAAMDTAAKRGMASFLGVPVKVYDKMPEAELDSLLLGTHDHWFDD